MKATRFLGPLVIGVVSSLPLFAFSPDRFSPNVVDRAEILSKAQKQQINETISRIRRQADILAAVYIVQSLEGESIEAAANQTFEKWALGKKGKDNGLLFMFSISDRQMRLEVGYGLESTIPDVTAKRIITQKATPLFRSGEYAIGVTDTLIAAAAAHLKSRGFSEDQIKEQLLATDAQISSGSDFPELNWGLYWLWIAFLILSQLRAAVTPSKPKFGKDNSLHRAEPFIRNATRFSAKQFFKRVLLTAFFALNPGIFILLIPKNSVEIVSRWVAENYQRVLLEGANAIVAHTVLSPLFVGWFLAVWLVPQISRRVAYQIAKRRGVPSGKWANPIFALSSDKRFVPTRVRWILILAVLLLPYFPFFMLAVVMSAHQAFLFVGIASPKFYKRHVLGRERLQRLQTRVSGTREVFGKVYTHTPRSSSSSSSSRSSSSSSSGGGRSGGGGASGRW